VDWYAPLCEAVHNEQVAFEQRVRSTDRALYGPKLALLEPDKVSVILINTVTNMAIEGGERGVVFVKLCAAVSDAIMSEVNYGDLKLQYGKPIIGQLGKPMSTRKINERARLSLDGFEWENPLKIKLGSMLVQLLLKIAKVDGEPAFAHDYEITARRSQGIIVASKNVRDTLSGAKVQGDFSFNARELPMLCPPTPWTHHDRGGFLKLSTRVMRTKGSRAQTEGLKMAQLERVFEGLNALGRLPWRINQPVLDTAQAAWDAKLAIAELPIQVDHPKLGLPPKEDRLVDPLKFREDTVRAKRVERVNSELHSLRCDANLKLSIAQQFRDDEIYFPFNLDFRGRAYPIPPNLNHLGSDLCRGMLTFSKKKPLGKDGLFWLKVHLANLHGVDKISFAERARWTDERLEKLMDSATKPLDGDRWWAAADSPWQALAVCREIRAALESKNPEAFESGQPVHMDGSCNGLQHYAALGRDAEGGMQVNLVDGDKPRDVYSGVCAIVNKRVSADAARELGADTTEEQLRVQKMSRQLVGLIDRKVVKQTVMTSVYGVTFIGARQQIQVDGAICGALPLPPS
jgi:DNA-directed RNA polymerase